MQSEAADLASRYLEGEHVIIPDRLFVALAETHDRYFAPGAGYHYSNANYQLAGMVLAAVTGKSLDELVRTRIVEPLGLRHTTVAPYDARSPDMRSYSSETTDGTLADLTDDLLALGNGASGGVISTGDELLNTMQAIVSGRLMSPPLVVEMKQPTVQSGRGSYGLGLATYFLSCGTFYGHGGAVDGTQSIALVNPDATSGVVIAVNLRTTADPNLLAVAESFLCAHK
jgi:D-alanyl-D-alanine carboxypeptidase